MSKTTRILALLAAVLAVTVAPAAASARPSGTSARTTHLQTALLGQINAFRVTRGLVALRLSPALAAAANGHSGQMARMGYFSHDSANGVSFSHRIARFYPLHGFRNWTVGENLVWGGPDIGAVRAFRLWVGSPMHRANLLSPHWREIGLGAVHSTSAPGVYGGGPATVVTVDFGARAH
jgi:uncharacterized protein YkwD